MTTCIPVLYKIMGRNLKRIRQKACPSQSRIGKNSGSAFSKSKNTKRALTAYRQNVSIR